MFIGVRVLIFYLFFSLSLILVDTDLLDDILSFTRGRRCNGLIRCGILYDIYSVTTGRQCNGLGGLRALCSALVFIGIIQVTFIRNETAVVNEIFTTRRMPEPERCNIYMKATADRALPLCVRSVRRSLTQQALLTLIRTFVVSKIDNC